MSGVQPPDEARSPGPLSRLLPWLEKRCEKRCTPSCFLQASSQNPSMPTLLRASAVAAVAALLACCAALQPLPLRAGAYLLALAPFRQVCNGFGLVLHG